MDGQLHLVFKPLIRWGFLPLLWPMYRCPIIFINTHSNFPKDQARDSWLDHKEESQWERSEATKVLAVRLLLWPWISHLTSANSSFRHSGGGRGVRIRPFQLKQSTILMSPYKFQMLLLNTGACTVGAGWHKQHAKSAKSCKTEMNFLMIF